MLRLIKKTLDLVRRNRPKKIRMWRLVDLGDDVGLYCFFDPRREKIFIYPLTSPESPGIMESMVSVSALEAGGGVAPHQISLFRRSLDAEI